MKPPAYIAVYIFATVALIGATCVLIGLFLHAIGFIR